MNRPVLSPPWCDSKRQRERGNTFSLLPILFPFNVWWFYLERVAGLVFCCLAEETPKRKKKNTKTIGVKVWVVSSWTTFTGHFFFALCCVRRFERAKLLSKFVINKWQLLGPPRSVEAFLCLYREVIKKPRRNEENWWFFCFVMDGQHIREPCGPKGKWPGRAEAIFPIFLLYRSP